MTQICAPKGCYFLARVYEVDQCTFAPVPGAANGYAFECFRNGESVPNVTEGNPVSLNNECGKSCWKTQVCDRTEAYDISFELLNPDWELTGLLTGNTLITDPLDPTSTVGYKTVEDNDCKPYVGLELFSRIPAGTCDDHGIEVRREIYVVRFGEPVESAETDADQVTFRTLTFTGTSSPYNPDAYGDGPFNDSYIDFTGDTESVHRIEFDDTIDPDTLEATCGLIPVLADA
jgi:hypothetical protein